MRQSDGTQSMCEISRFKVVIDLPVHYTVDASLSVPFLALALGFSVSQ
jgi:hypothetical protein